MPEIVADLPDPSCFFGSGIEESQPLAPDLFLPRAREARAIARTGKDTGFLRVRARQPCLT
jgi:hypothetical protein